jgi:8-oxo-dGTP pyrophosphatase MutT (NUDIX family)
VDRGETVREAAVREVREEAGVEADVVVPLESVHYFYQSRGQRVAKTVDFFLMTYRRGDPADHDEEVDEVRWFPLGEADVLAFPSERTVVEQAAGLLSESVGG